MATVIFCIFWGDPSGAYVGVVLHVSESGWERVHVMHITVYSKKNWTVESLRWCFTNLHCTKAPSGNPLILQEVEEAKITWLQI
eukprot:13760446-Ditylum_brightwellii.AAC.1